MLHSITIRLIHVYTLETIYLCYGVKCQPGVTWDTQKRAGFVSFQRHLLSSSYLARAAGQGFILQQYPLLTLPAQRGRVLYCNSFRFLPCPRSGAGFYIATISLSFFLSFFLLSHGNISDTLCPILPILGQSNKSVNAHF